MTRFWIIICLVVCHFGCRPTNKAISASMSAFPNALSVSEKKEGWKLLFDGQTTNGWHQWGGGKAGSAWVIEDSSLHLSVAKKNDWQVAGGGDILSDEEYGNFHLKLDWKIASCGNSGIIFLGKEDAVKYKHIWNTGPEMQILDNTCHADAKIIKHRAGDLYDLITATPETVRPAGDWNQVEIIHNNGILKFYLNGVLVVNTNLDSQDFKQLIKNSKWAHYDDFLKFPSGRIALQDHGDAVWFRNIKIKNL